MDIQILHFFNNFTGKHIYLDTLFIFFAVYFPIFFAAAHLLYFYKAKKMWLWFWSFIAAAFSLLAKEIISLFYFRIRPFETIEGINNLINKSAEEASFPSGHTMVGFVLAFSVFWVNKKWGVIFLISALVVALSRIIVGVHFPTDILGGIIIAFVLSLIVKNRKK